MVDQDQNGFISYEEFLRATIDLKDILSEKNLEEAFKQFDKNGDGSISALEIKEVLGKGLNISDNVWEDIVKQVDINNDGEVKLYIIKVSLEEFKKMMRKLIT
jgi:Ca2+-binding EF-hand superfamily protein